MKKVTIWQSVSYKVTKFGYLFVQENSIKFFVVHRLHYVDMELGIRTSKNFY